MKKKISLIGAGQIGGTLSTFNWNKRTCQMKLYLFDVASGIAKGKALRYCPIFISRWFQCKIFRH